MPFYEVCRVTIESNVPLPELRVVGRRAARHRFRLLPGPLPEPRPRRWTHPWKFADGRTWLSFARTESSYFLRFPGLATFVSRDGGDIRCHCAPDMPLETIRHLLLDQVIPLVLSMDGELVLHAGAVAAPQGAIAFVGTSGLGKSTLIASLCQHGFPLLSDDGLLLVRKAGRLLSVPSYPGLRLWPDVLGALFAGSRPKLTPVAHYTEKLRLPVNRRRLGFCTKPVPLHRMYFLAAPPKLDADSKIEITALPVKDRFMELVKHAYRVDLTDERRLRQEFTSLARVANLPVLRRLSFPRDLRLLPEVRKAILRDLEAAG